MKEGTVDTVFLTSREIASATYDSGKARLQLEMRRGGVYEIAEVPESVYRMLVTCQSPGTYYHLHIRKGDYPIRRLR
nr:KTSC domain-containing protein [Rhizobium halophytocola]